MTYHGPRSYRKHLFCMYMYICFGLKCKFILHDFDNLNYGLPMLQSAPFQPAVHTLSGQIYAVFFVKELPTHSLYRFSNDADLVYPVSS